MYVSKWKYNKNLSLINNITDPWFLYIYFFIYKRKEKSPSSFPFPHNNNFTSSTVDRTLIFISFSNKQYNNYKRTLSKSISVYYFLLNMKALSGWCLRSGGSSRSIVRVVWGLDPWHHIIMIKYIKRRIMLILRLIWNTSIQCGG